MMLPRSVADVLADHVTLEVECIDRMYLNLYQPRLQHELGVVGFFKCHRGFPFVSSVLMDPISRTFVAGIHRFVTDQGVDLVDFRPGQRKDDVAHEYLAENDGLSWPHRDGLNWPHQLVSCSLALNAVSDGSAAIGSWDQFTGGSGSGRDRVRRWPPRGSVRSRLLLVGPGQA